MEVWVNIKEHPDYQISNHARIKSFKNNKEKILKGFIQNTGYLTVVLDDKKYSIHRLVAETFIPRVKNKDYVNHKDGNKLNNNLDNLEWCTLKENIQHAYKTGLMNNVIEQLKIKKIRAKTIEQYDLNGTYINSYKGSVEAQQYLNSKGIAVNARNIRSVCEGKRKTAGGYFWKFAKSGE